MTDRIKEYYEILKSGTYKKLRKEPTENAKNYTSSVEYEDCEGFGRFLSDETPLFFGNDTMGFHMSMNIMLPSRCGNVSPDYGRVITLGFDRILAEIDSAVPKDFEQAHFAKMMKKNITAALDFSKKYRDAAEKSGHKELAAALGKIPRNGAETFYEACVFLKFCVYILRAFRVEHVTIGRFDTYMYPFYLNSKKAGVSDEDIFEEIEMLFISLGFDTDLYPGVQRGDNGQSLMIGGTDADGNYIWNELSDMCLEASRELKLIDPKINVRVCKKTPDDVYYKGTLLTKEGLGFPQYSNDDVVVPGLMKLGYSADDALDYAVAACWEFLIPGKSAEVPNIATLDFPRVTLDGIIKSIEDASSFDDVLSAVKESITAECAEVIKESCSHAEWWCRGRELSLLSVFIGDCTKTLIPCYNGGAKYTNYGCHGAGISVAADSLAAVKTAVFDKKMISKDELTAALRDNFSGENGRRVRAILKSCPKMGNDDDCADDIACELMKTFSEHMNNIPNDRGGVFRAGTGSAQNYVFLGEKCPATPDGRLAFNPYPSSYSPALGVKTAGLLSVARSFTKYDLSNIINGGPLTIEVHNSVFRNEEGIRKVAQFVKAFITLGGHQLQINSVNKDILLDAKAHPDKHRDLIVRVWGWSGYFCELDEKFQDQIIQRLEYTS